MSPDSNKLHEAVPDGKSVKNLNFKVATIQVLTNGALFGAGLFIPLLAMEQMNADIFQIGLIVALYGISLFVSSYLFGRAADLHGRKRYLVIGLFVSGIACLIQIFTPDLITLALARIILGLCGGIFPSALAAYAYERGVRMGRFTSHSALGFGLGSIIASLIVFNWGATGHAMGREIYNPVFVGCAVMFFACFAILLTLPFPQEKMFKVPFFPRKIIKDNLPVYLSYFIRHTGACAVWAFFSLFIFFMQPAGTPEHVKFFWIGLINGVNGIGQFVFMQYIDKYKSETLIITGFILSAITFALFIFVTNVWQLLLTQVLLAAAWSCLYVGSIILVMEKNPEHATSAGLLNSSLNAAQVIGPLLGGVVASIFATYELHIGGWVLGGSGIGSIRSIMLLAVFLSLIALAVFLWSDKRSKRNHSHSA